MLRLFLLPVTVFRRFREERLMQTAASLSFTTLLGLVPFVAVAVAVASMLPSFAHFDTQIQLFLQETLLPEKAGKVITKYALVFSGKAHRLTWVGAVVVIATALALMLSIDRAINHIWKVPKHRPLWSSLPIYLVVVTLGPLVLGLSVAVSYYVVNKSLGLAQSPDWLDDFALRLLPSILLAGLFSFMYLFVPNCKVNRWHAIVGGVLAAIGFEALQRVLALYFAKFSSYAVLYGAFAAMPIFLIWLHLSWSLVLVCALIVAELRHHT